ncbi:MAG: hypothetical protein R2798_12705 [Chitinophagales bacterium]|nr:hypothetical protein [Bacteroidota bacterium]MCB9042525.1 hypothetical protein [Chitinophagales bacterium]
MSKAPNSIQNIVELLRNNHAAKQKVFHLCLGIFDKMRYMTQQITEAINQSIEDVAWVSAEFMDKGEFEFQVRLSGELIVFSFHSNIITFPENHVINANPYIKENELRSYFGVFLAYNFLNDAIKYNRLHDQGYLIARMFVNIDEKYYIEGVRQLNFLHPNVAENDLHDEMLFAFISSCFLAALQNNSVVPDFESEKVINIAQLINSRMLGNIQKVGYQLD